MDKKDTKVLYKINFFKKIPQGQFKGQNVLEE